MPAKNNVKKMRMLERFTVNAFEPSSDLGIGCGFCATIDVVKE